VFLTISATPLPPAMSHPGIEKHGRSSGDFRCPAIGENRQRADEDRQVAETNRQPWNNLSLRIGILTSSLRDSRPRPKTIRVAAHAEPLKLQPAAQWLPSLQRRKDAYYPNHQADNAVLGER
jgi:hypothetical protein